MERGHGAGLCVRRKERLGRWVGDPAPPLGQEDPGGGNGNPPTLIFLPGQSHGQRSLVGYSPWADKETDTTECLNTRNRWMNMKMNRARDGEALAWVDAKESPRNAPCWHQRRHNYYC